MINLLTNWALSNARMMDLEESSGPDDADDELLEKAEMVDKVEEHIKKENISRCHLWSLLVLECTFQCHLVTKTFKISSFIFYIERA